MTMPHVCRCEKCGREMPETFTLLDNKTAAAAPGFVMPALGAPYPMDAAVVATACQYMCTKHGLIQFPDCDQCAAEKRAQTVNGDA